MTSQEDLKDQDGNLSNVEEILLQSDKGEKVDLMSEIFGLVQQYSTFMSKVQTDYTEIMSKLKEIITSINFSPDFYISNQTSTEETIPITNEEFVEVLNFMDQNYLTMCQIYEQAQK